MTHTSRRLSISLVLTAALLTAVTANGIIVRHDQADSSYVVDEADYPQIFSLHYRFDNRVCIATLISPQWAITAAHCTDQTPILETMKQHEPYRLTVNGRPYTIDELVIHPAYLSTGSAGSVDLALIKLDRPVADVEPVLINRKTDELDQVVQFLGWGFTGWGTVGRRNNDGRLRRAYNSVMEVGQWLKFRFDDPRQVDQKTLQLEGVPGLGDSGGPALADTEAGYVLLGVALGEVAYPEGSEEKQGLYGAIEIYERISSHLQWIDSTIGTMHTAGVAQ